MLSILYKMSSEAYAKLVAHNNTVVQQFKSYKEAQERALTEAYSRLAALKEFCAKEREEMREAFEKEKQAMRDRFEREKQSALALALEKERQSALALEKERQSALALALEKDRQSASALALEKDRQSALALEKKSALALEPPSSNEQVISDFMAGFFKANQNDTC